MRLIVLAGVVILGGAIVTAAKWDEWVEGPRLRAGLLRWVNDPGSVETRGERVSHAHGPVLCGEANYRGLEGGYVGFSRFVSTETEAAMYGRGFDAWPDYATTVAVARRMDYQIAALQRGDKAGATEEAALRLDFDRLWERYCSG